MVFLFLLRLVFFSERLRRFLYEPPRWCDDVVCVFLCRIGSYGVPNSRVLYTVPHMSLEMPFSSSASSKIFEAAS